MEDIPYFVLVGKKIKGKTIEIPKDIDLKIIEEYPNKLLVELTPYQHQQLLQKGFDIKDLSSRDKIRIGGLIFDPKILEERKEVIDQDDEIFFFEAGYFFIQFIGPVKQEWIKKLEEIGITPLLYYHDFTYLVQGKIDVIESLANVKYIRSTMPYAPKCKLTSVLRTQLKGNENKDLEGEYWILIFTGISEEKQTITQLEELGVKVLEIEKSKKFYQKIHVNVKRSTLQEIIKNPNVYIIEPFYPEVDEDEIADLIIAGQYNNLGQVSAPTAGTHPYLDWLNDIGVDGSGVTVGIMEASACFDENHAAFAGRANFPAGITAATAQNRGNHATMVAGQCAGNYQIDLDANNYIYGLGVAPGANLINQNINDETNDTDRCESTVSNGGMVQNNSWGSGTANPMDYQDREKTYDECVRDSEPNNAGHTPLIVCFSAGNSGTAGLTRPKAAKNIITTGNFENYRPSNLFGCGENDADDINERYTRTCADSGSGESSIGNSEDGRIKPDVVAPGQWSASASFGVTAANNPNRFINNLLAYGGGTSAASPKTAGTAALIIQWWRQRHTVDNVEISPSPAMVKAMLINGAVDTGEGGNIPNEEQGWGRINLNNVFNPELPTIFVDQNIVLQQNSADIEFEIEPSDISIPLKLSLIWTDVPGAANSNPAIVNALGLEINEGNFTWFGNNFAGGFSQTGGNQDAIQNVHPGIIVNNTQNIYIQNPSNKTHHIRIFPDNIVGDCLSPRSPYNLPSIWQQDFALVIQNAFLTTNEPLDVMLAVDRTGSMTGDRMNAAIASGQEFFDLLPNNQNHLAGVVSYAAPNNDAPLDDKVTVDLDLAVVNDALKNTAQNSLGLLNANGWTSIGAGLIKAMQRIINNGVSLHRKVIVLLSDGKENRSPYVSEVLPFLRKEYRVHTIGLGGSINGPLMQQIADETHATFLHTLNPDDITPLYREIFALEAGEDVVGHEDGIISPEEDSSSDIKRFPIIDSDKKATFIIGWKNKAVSLEVELVTPKGNTITPVTTANSPTMDYIKRDTHIIYTIRYSTEFKNDWEGDWSVRTRNASVQVQGNESYNVSVLVDSSLRIKPIWNKLKYFIKDIIGLKVLIVDNKRKLKDGVKMTIRITAPQVSFNNILKEINDKLPSRKVDDMILKGHLKGLDTLSEKEWKAKYQFMKKKSQISFEAGGSDIPDKKITHIITMPHFAKMKTRIQPIHDGIYTFQIKVEGHTASGARYTRVRTISKYVDVKERSKLKV